jgi:hypothetical protein
MSSSPTPEDRPVRAYLLKKLCSEDEGLFALGVSIARVVQMADSDDQGTQSLAYHVLSDVALTQKILRLANTPQYRQASGAPVTTISHAISLLGFDNVKTTALAMLLVDTLANSKHAQSVRVELEAALCASLVGARTGTLQPLPEGGRGGHRRPVQEPGTAADRFARARTLPRNQCPDGRRPAYAGTGVANDPGQHL